MATGKKENYALRVLRLASMDKLNSVVDEVCEKSGQSHLGTLADMAHCLRKFGAGYYDYWIDQYPSSAPVIGAIPLPDAFALDPEQCRLESVIVKDETEFREMIAKTEPPTIEVYM